MKVIEFFDSKLAQAKMSGRHTQASAYNVTAKAYPDAAILLKARGKTTNSVRFANTSRPPGSVTASEREASRQFANSVHQQMKETGCTYAAAYNRLSSTNPQFVNADSTSSKKVDLDQNGVPIFGPQLKAIFRLPQDLTTSEAAAVWEANGKTARPMNYGKVFDALCEIPQKEKGMNFESALSATKARFPRLWDEVQGLADLGL